MKIRLQQQKTGVETLIVPFLKNDNLSAQLAQVATTFGFNEGLLTADFKAGFKESLVLYPQTNVDNVNKVVLLGLGEKNGAIEWLTAFRSLINSQKSKFSAHIGIDLLAMENIEGVVLESIVNGVALGRYNINLYKTDKTDPPVFCTDAAEVTLFSHSTDVAAIEKGRMTAETQMRIFDLVNAGANYKTPKMLAKWAEKSGETYDYNVTTYVGRKALAEQNLHAVLAVNAGSAADPAFIIMEYKGEGENLPKIGLVGKGVTFDTGGISIKPSTNMANMKSDMGGAAAVLGTLELVAKLKLPVHLIGIVPSTENCVDGKSTKPSEVFQSYAGKTIEMIDTDAEGRIILADGLAYMCKNFQPDTLIDLATLTGSVIATLGYTAAGLFTNSDDLADKLLQIGQKTGEKLWRLPLWDAYKDDLNSDVADVRNFSGKPVAGAITAAKFLEVFTDKHPNWAHLDIAGTAFTDSEFASMKSSTAYGVRLLTAFVESLIPTV
jgi:leucyl aminopeptidase